MQVARCWPACLVATAAAVLVAAGSAVAQDVGFARDVRPIFAERCAECHGPDDSARMADLHLDSPDDLGADRGGYRLVVPGDPEASELLRRITATEAERMPPASHGPAVPANEADVIRRWIAQGGEWEPHWAYAPFRDVEPPRTRRDAVERNPIDAFVVARLEREGLVPAAPADRRTLIRRVSLDLTGLPPTPDEIAAFLRDAAPDAYERLVDRLLASPHYAERWARHWLDLARYADSNGFTIDGARSMWPYRDWVIEAIDEDMPFDRFTIEQLAGDLLPDPTNAQLVATGFHRNTQINQEGGAKDEENRVNAVIDRVNTTGAVWLGSTLACAQCHTHKYDPVTHAEYYRMLAFFDQTEDGGVSTDPSLAVTDDASAPMLARFEAERARLESMVVQAERAAGEGWARWTPDRAVASEGPELRLQAAATIRSLAHNPQTSLYELTGLAPRQTVGAVRLEALPDLSLPGHGPGRAENGGFVVTSLRLLSRAAGQGEAFVEHPLEGDTRWDVRAGAGQPHAAVFRLATPISGEGRELRLEIRQDHGRNHVLGRFRVAFGPDRRVRSRSGAGLAGPGVVVPDAWRQAWSAYVGHEATRPDLPQTLVMRERPPERRRTTRIFRRGSFLDPGPEVQAGFPAAMDHVSRAEVPATRLDLARWLVHPENALVHRVTVNRWWQRFFGLGIVETENDFGLRGSRPSHPDLLEWLARELVRREFSMKAIHRLIVTSATYRQSSAPRAELVDRDPRNRLLARQVRLRLDAESIRDSALRVSGVLSTTVGGPPVQPPQPDGVFAFTQSRKTWETSQGADRYRRTLYTRIWRSSPYPFLSTFDAPQATVTCTRRLRSSTPLQALTLANDPMMLELAEGLGRRLRAEASRGSADGADGGIALGFELALGRPPTPTELAIVRGYLVRERLRVGDRGSDADRDQAWTAVARVLFNLGEFVTRP